MSGGVRLLSQELAALGLDLASTLQEGPRFLLDAQFLGALHAELGEQLGAEEARAALLQLGFLHGLRDAAEVLRAGFGPGVSPTAIPPAAPSLAIHFQPVSSSSEPGALALSGSWPERREAAAVLASCGQVAGPSCHASAGYTSGWLSGIFDADVVVAEESCASSGAAQCSFCARDIVSWERAESPAAREMAGALPFQALREVVAQYLETHPPPASQREEAFEPGTPVVHVWGPVMVLPFAGPEESLRALELIGQDPGARDVRVVIVDLSGTLVDDGFGAAALEQILGAIEGWGAEPILTGVSPLSARVVGELESSHLVLHKDLANAIAVGFQIADAQRHVS